MHGLSEKREAGEQLATRSLMYGIGKTAVPQVKDLHSVLAVNESSIGI